jgi:hypothetical protein
MERFLGVYWIIYYLAYLIASAILLWLYWDGLLREDGNIRIFLLAAVFGTAAGTAFIFTILVEVGVRTMLLIPAAVRKLKREGRLEGRQEGRLEGRHERDKRYEEAYRRFGVEVDGVVMLPRTAEVREFLNRNSEESGNPGD